MFKAISVTRTDEFVKITTNIDVCEQIYHTLHHACFHLGKDAIVRINAVRKNISEPYKGGDVNTFVIGSELIRAVIFDLIEASKAETYFSDRYFDLAEFFNNIRYEY